MYECMHTVYYTSFPFYVCIDACLQYIKLHQEIDKLCQHDSDCCSHCSPHVLPANLRPPSSEEFADSDMMPASSSFNRLECG